MSATHADVAAASVSAAKTCFHCGQPIAPQAHYPIHQTADAKTPAQEHAACCRGCQAVAQAILDAGLHDYYQHRTQLPDTPQTTALAPVLAQLKLYDAPEIQQSFVKVEDEYVREASLILEGITCAACVWLNERHLIHLKGVLAVEINYSNHRARIRWDERVINLSRILQAIQEIGYIAHPFDVGRHESLYRQERKTALQRLFVAGFGMMQVMMYAVPLYLADGDMTADIELLMRVASLILTLPVVTYASIGFYRNAWRDLRRGRVGMDVPVSLGILLSFLASVWGTMHNALHVYYDSATMFVFFLLCGRYVEMVARNRANEAVDSLVKLIPAFTTRLPLYPDTQTQEAIPVAQLRPQDVVLVRAGETIPSDGCVLEGESEADESLLTGESRPIPKRTGDKVTGGAVNMSSSLLVRVTQVGQDTLLSGIVRLLDRALAEKPQLTKIADQIAAWFVLVVLVLAAVTFVAWQWYNPDQALWAAVAVLVVTCPCALSLATPVALTAATGYLTRQGLLVTRGHALETLARASHVIFDKTGTLTEGRLSLQQLIPLASVSSADCLALAAALEHHSEHPLAKALSVHRTDIHATQLRTQAGAGVSGEVDGQIYHLGKAAFVQTLHGLPVPDLSTPVGSSVVWLGSAQGWLAALVFADQVREEAKTVVQALQNAGKTVCLLSGDEQATAHYLGKQLGIETIHGGMTPAEKLAYVQTLQQQGAVVAMLGDGINDAPVLAGASVSIAMGEGTAVAQASADMILLGRLSQLLVGFDKARRTMRVIRQNLGWAIIYNVVAVPFAALGWITPWLAGLGMTMSSLLVVLNAVRLTKAR